MSQIDRADLRHDQRSPKSPSTAPAATAQWASGSLAVVLPVRGNPGGVGPIGPGNELWDLHHLSASPLRRESSSLDDARVRTMRSGVNYRVLQGRQLSADPVLAEALPRPQGCLIRAIEIFTYDDVEAMSYVVLHVVLTAPALTSVEGTVTWFADPSSRSETSWRRWSSVNRQALLRALGFPNPLRARPDDVQPFVISHLLPKGQSIPELDSNSGAASAPARTLEQQWAYRLSTGSTATDSRSEAGPCCESPDGYWLGSTWCRASSQGLALIGTRGVKTRTDPDRPMGWQQAQEEHLQPAALEEFAHRDAVDIVILAMRQSAFLVRHADDLADAWDIQLDSTPTTFESVLRTGDSMREQAARFDERLEAFRRDLWSEHGSADESISTTITSVQRALGCNAKLREIENEQFAITRALIGSADHIKERVAGQHVEIDSAPPAPRALSERVVETVLFVIAALGMTYAAGQVAQGDNGPAPYFWVAVLVIAGTLFATWIVGRVLLWRADRADRDQQRLVK